jgi:hypothetical protein
VGREVAAVQEGAAVEGSVSYDKSALGVFEHWKEILPTEQVVASDWKPAP